MQGVSQHAYPRVPRLSRPSSISIAELPRAIFTLEVCFNLHNTRHSLTADSRGDVAYRASMATKVRRNPLGPLTFDEN